MKRSEMTQKMTELWLGLFPNEKYSDEDLYVEVRERMGQLLNYLEHKGMLPPLKKNCPVTLRTEHVWEDENE